MSGWAFVFMVIGIGSVASWVFRVVDLIEAPARRRARW